MVRHFFMRFRRIWASALDVRHLVPGRVRPRALLPQPLEQLDLKLAALLLCIDDVVALASLVDEGVDLLRADRSGEVAEARDELRAAGVVVGFERVAPALLPATAMSLSSSSRRAAPRVPPAAA